MYLFRPGHSTELALVTVIDKLSKAAKNSETSLGVFLDLSKAFDTIDHTILLQKLFAYGFRVKYHMTGSKIILTGRKQLTSFKKQKF